MTGSESARHRRLWWLGGLLLAGPAAAQFPGVPGSPNTPNTPAPNVPDIVNQSVSTGATPAGRPARPSLGPLPKATLTWQSESGGPSDSRLDGVHFDYGGELKADADHLRGDVDRGRYDATGHVYAHERDTTLKADALHVNAASVLGFSLHSFLTRRPYTLRADRLDFQPGKLVATRANVTTAPPDDLNPDVGLLADTLVVTPAVNKNGVVDPRRQHLEFRNARIYLLHNHLITIPHFKTTVGNDAQTNQPPHPTAGYSGRYGAYVGYGGVTRAARSTINFSAILPTRQQPQLLATGSQLLGTALPPRPAPASPPGPPVTPTLAALRLLTTSPRPPLPDGDPLLFHDFLPVTGPILLFNQPPPAYLVSSEELATHQQSYGRNANNDLYVSRLPDINLYSAVPLNRIQALPTNGDPRAFRHALRRLDLYAGLSGEIARFYEQSTSSVYTSPAGAVAPPESAYATRGTLALRLFTQPILVARDTVLLPAYTYAFNHYTGVSGSPYPDREFDYSQISVAVQHYFSTYSGVGAQFFDNQSRGNSPLNFDVFSASRELDGRAQVGDRHLAVAGFVRYDVLAHRVFDYTVTVAPGLRGFTPVFSYTFFSQSLGVSLAIPGLTF